MATVAQMTAGSHLMIAMPAHGCMGPHHSFSQSFKVMGWCLNLFPQDSDCGRIYRNLLVTH